jgi:hypothetical protein
VRFLKDYQNRNIRLTEERLAHILDHPEMAELEEAIEKTLSKPQLVVRSTTDTEAALSYRFYFGTRVGNKWLCVVVKYKMDDAFVLTAYLTDKPKKGEQIWPSITPTE